MIRNIILLFNIAALLIYKAFFSQDVNITSNFPSSVKAGESFTVELVINKAAVSGFAKFQQELPAGFTATAIETKSASFSFIDQAVKLIWMSLPSDNEFKVSYKVTVGPEVAGTHSINGKFSYIENNEKKVFNLTPKEITVEGSQVASNTTQPASTGTVSESKPQTDTANNTASSANTSRLAEEGTSGSTQPATTSSTTQPADISCSRNIPSTVSSNEFTVEVTVKKKDISGFAKLEESLPNGFSATGIETKNAVFSFVDQKAKFLWMNLPTEAEFTVSYRVTVDPSVNSSSYSIDGLFSYLINDITQKATIPASSFNYNKGGETATTTTSAGSDTASKTSTETSLTQKTDQSENTSTSTETPQPVTEPKKQEPTLTSTPSPSKGVNYRVQVSATKKSAEASAIKEAYKLNEEIFAEMHEGWHKFTIGSFSAYQAARDKRVEVSANKDIPGPFVAAYNSGKRITVQEALMISNQKWVK